MGETEYFGHKEVVSSSSSNLRKQVIEIVNPPTNSKKPHYWQRNLNQLIIVIKKDFFNENPREITKNPFMIIFIILLVIS